MSNEISNRDILDVLLEIKEDVSNVRSDVNVLKARQKDEVVKVKDLDEDLKALNAKVNRAHGGILVLMFVISTLLAVLKML